MNNAPEGRRIKHAAPKTPAARVYRFRFSDALRALEHDGARSVALSAFKELGGNRDDLRGPSLAALREALTRAEDWLELERPRVDRSRLRDLRRRVEEASL